jgi:cytochrome c
VPVRPDRKPRIVATVLAFLALVAIAAFILRDARKEQTELETRVSAMTGGDVEHGAQLFASYGCGACHSVSKVPGATGQVGPPLDNIGGRAIIAGKLSNNPQNLIRWIMDPQAVTPGTAMPRLGVTQKDAQDIAAFLYSRS